MLEYLGVPERSFTRGDENVAQVGPIGSE